MRAHVDDDSCRGHATCWSLCPEVFTLTDDGYAVAVEGEVPAEFEGAVREAVSNCPERAITVT
jgi:ferredoxin